MGERLLWTEGDTGCAGLRGWAVGWAPYQRRQASGLFTLSPLRFKLNGMLLSQPHLLFGCYQMLEEWQGSRHKQNPQR